MPCGAESMIGMLTGAGDVKSPGINGVGRDYSGLIKAFQNGVGPLFDTQSEFQPKYSNLLLNDVEGAAPRLTQLLSLLGPQAASIVQGANPGGTDLMARLNRTASEGLDAGASMDPELARFNEQNIRGGQAARGMGFGPSDVLQESSAMTQFGDSLRRYRQGFASNVANMDQSASQPILALLTQILGGAGSASSGAAQSLLQPSKSLDLLSMPYQGRMSAATQSANNSVSLLNSSSANSNWT